MNFRNFSIALFLVALIALPAMGQLNTLTGTTLSVAAAITDNTVTVASATGVVAPNPSTGVVGSLLYVQSPGSKAEAMRVQSISGTVITVARGRDGSSRVAHTSGALVLLGRPDLFKSVDPSGACTAATTEVTPYVNVKEGRQWLCSTITLSWVPGWGNTSRPVQPTAAVASAAGSIIPSGPLFHVTGTAAITGFTVPLGFSGGPFCIIPDGAFTTTAAGNIAIASTAVASKLLCYGYDAAAAKPFFATY